MKTKILFGTLVVFTLCATGCSNDKTVDHSTTVDNGTLNQTVVETIAEKTVSEDNPQAISPTQNETTLKSNTEEKVAEKLETNEITPEEKNSKVSKKEVKQENTITEVETPAVEPEPKVEEKKIDLDITEKMFVTYINEVYTNPSSYIGKRLRIEGMFSAQYFEPTNTTYYYVYRTGPGCCGTDGSMCGFEFTSESGYPNANDWIEVVGVLDQYDEYGTKYLTIRAESVTVKSERGLEVVSQ